MNLGFLYTSPFLPVTGYCTPIYYSHNLHIFKLISLSLLSFSAFPYYFHSGSHYFDIPSLFILSIYPYHLNLREIINFTMFPLVIYPASHFILILILQPPPPSSSFTDHKFPLHCSLQILPEVIVQASAIFLL